MNCPECRTPVVMDIRVTVWQRARGTFSDDNKTFYATDCETLWDSEEELNRELMCPECSWNASAEKIEVEWV